MKPQWLQVLQDFRALHPDGIMATAITEMEDALGELSEQGQRKATLDAMAAEAQKFPGGDK